MTGAPGSRVVAIDGPAGSGKSTVARAVADALGVDVLDTGAMYRAVTIKVLDAGIDPTDAEAVTQVAEGADIVLTDVVELDGRDVTDEIRSPAVNAAVSTVSAHPGVRRVLIAQQRKWAEMHGGGVAEGRDMGAVVFPDAPLKVFLTASPDERARRRSGDETAASIAQRDGRDVPSTLEPTADAFVLDTTGMSVAEVVAAIVGRLPEARRADLLGESQSESESA
ncbi:MAG: cytidylate kinase [Actinomycetia bacterium]|nr:cytidylate kinase [Actinomycetes bacterium]